MKEKKSKRFKKIMKGGYREGEGEKRIGSGWKR